MPKRYYSMKEKESTKIMNIVMSDKYDYGRKDQPSVKYNMGHNSLGCNSSYMVIIL